MRPAVGPILLPQPVSSSTVRSGVSIRNALTVISGAGGRNAPVRMAAAPAASIPVSTSAGSASAPSFSAVTTMSPTLQR